MTASLADFVHDTRCFGCGYWKPCRYAMYPMGAWCRQCWLEPEDGEA